MSPYGDSDNAAMAYAADDLEATIAGIRQALAAANAPRLEWVPPGKPGPPGPLPLVPGPLYKLDLPPRSSPSVHVVPPGVSPPEIREDQDQLTKDIERLRSEKLQLERDIARNDQRNSRSSGQWEDEGQGGEDDDGPVFARSARPKVTRSAAPLPDVQSQLPHGKEPSRMGEDSRQEGEPGQNGHSFTNHIPQPFHAEKEITANKRQPMPEPEHKSWDQSEDVDHQLYQMYFPTMQEEQNKLHEPRSPPIDVRQAMPARAQAPPVNTRMHGTTVPGYPQQFPGADIVPGHNSTQQATPTWARRPPQGMQNQPQREIYPSGRMSAPDTELQYSSFQGFVDQAQHHPQEPRQHSETWLAPDAAPEGRRSMPDTSHSYTDYGYGYSDYGQPNVGNVLVPENVFAASKPPSPPKAPTLLQRPDSKKRQTTVREAEQAVKDRVKEKKRDVRAAAPASLSGPRSHKAPESPQAQIQSNSVAIDAILPPSLVSSHYAPHVPDADAEEVIYSDYGGTFSMKDIQTPPHTPKGLRNAAPYVKPSNYKASRIKSPMIDDDDVLDPTTCEILYKITLQDEYPLIDQAGTMFTVGDSIAAAAQQHEYKDEYKEYKDEYKEPEPPLGILRTEYTDQVGLVCRKLCFSCC